MRRTIGFTVVLIVLAFHNNAFAADANGYEARYEFPVGSAPACQQTITVMDPWSAINWNADVICIAPGDHRSKGPLTLNSSGTATKKKWLRLAGSDSIHPVKQQFSQMAILARLTAADKQHWIVDRLTFYPLGGTEAIHFGNCDYCIVNRVLIDGQHTNDNLLVRYKHVSGGGSGKYTEHSALQNSVIRNTGKVAGKDVTCLNFGGTDNRIVNNEIYNCGGDGIVFNIGNYPLQTKVENNDIYQTSDYLIGCDGNPGTTCNCGEDGIDIKNNDTTDPANALVIIHNRIWGWRRTYSSCSGTGGDGFAINVGDVEPKRFVVVKNNIIESVSNGVNLRSNTSDWLVIGNLLYDVNHADGTYSDALRLAHTDNHQVYLNTVVDSRHGLWVKDDGENNDLRCNVFMNVQHITRASSPAWGAGSTADYNAFYNTDAFYWDADAARSVAYERVEDAQALPYCYLRKLHTEPESSCIPNARPTV
ncbi:MAG: right-handed parallel beta-helix repeat-containing protein, partial [Gammaproteobacteria bacterium]|nr:right-handed parallel beta-helix repeat-containing protein [Gammaproteobacteria bacterium]